MDGTSEKLRETKIVSVGMELVEFQRIWMAHLALPKMMGKEVNGGVLMTLAVCKLTHLSLV